MLNLASKVGSKETAIRYNRWDIKVLAKLHKEAYIRTCLTIVKTMTSTLGILIRSHKHLMFSFSSSNELAS